MRDSAASLQCSIAEDAGRAYRDRRLRDRLQLARLSAPVSRRRAQDRPLLHLRRRRLHEPRTPSSTPSCNSARHSGCKPSEKASKTRRSSRDCCANNATSDRVTSSLVPSNPAPSTHSSMTSTWDGDRRNRPRTGHRHARDGGPLRLRILVLGRVHAPDPDGACTVRAAHAPPGPSKRLAGDRMTPGRVAVPCSTWRSTDARSVAGDCHQLRPWFGLPGAGPGRVDRLQGRGVLRLLDLLFVSKSEDGTIQRTVIGDDDFGRCCRRSCRLAGPAWRKQGRPARRASIRLTRRHWHGP